MKFYESPFYQQDVIDLQTLQSRVQELFVLMHVQEDNEVRVEFLHALYAMIEKEQCLLVRLQLELQTALYDSITAGNLCCFHRYKEERSCHRCHLSRAPYGHDANLQDLPLRRTHRER